MYSGRTQLLKSCPAVRECLLIDMSHLVMSKAFTKSTFGEFFISIGRCLLAEIPSYKRIDVICDNHQQVNELKWSTTAARGINGTRVPLIRLNMHVPSSFHGDYMRNDDNKLEFYRELLQYLHALSLSYSDNYGEGPSKFLDVYLADNNIFKTFQDIIIHPERFLEHFSEIECFILRLYNVHDPTYGCTRARYDLLLHKRIRSLRELPPSTGALLSQARRAAYIAAIYWGTIISSKT